MGDPKYLRYTRTHEWVNVGPDGLIWVGITDRAQRMLGDIVYVGDFKVGETVRAEQPVGVIESVKAAFDVYSPLEGEIVEFNLELESHPQLINEDPFGSWIYKMRTRASLDDLLDAAAYERIEVEQ